MVLVGTISGSDITEGKVKKARLPSDTAYAADLTPKANDSAVVHNTGAEAVAGVKTLTSAPVVPDASFTIAKTSGLQAALNAKADATTDIAWTRITAFASGWSGYVGGNWDGVWYCRRAGTAFISGGIQKSSAYTSGETMFTVPSGSRPSATAQGWSASVAAPAVATSGAVFVTGGGTSAFSFGASYPAA